MSARAGAQECERPAHASATRGGAYDCIKVFTETDFTEDLKKIDVPALIIHGDDDQIVPIGASAHLSHKLVRNSVLKIYRGGGHKFSLGDHADSGLQRTGNPHAGAVGRKPGGVRGAIEPGFPHGIVAASAGRLAGGADLIDAPRRAVR